MTMGFQSNLRFKIDVFGFEEANKGLLFQCNSSIFGHPKQATQLLTDLCLQPLNRKLGLGPALGSKQTAGNVWKFVESVVIVAPKKYGKIVRS